MFLTGNSYDGNEDILRFLQGTATLTTGNWYIFLTGNSCDGNENILRSLQGIPVVTTGTTLLRWLRWGLLHS